MSNLVILIFVHFSNVMGMTYFECPALYEKDFNPYQKYGNSQQYYGQKHYFHCSNAIFQCKYKKAKSILVISEFYFVT